MIFFLFIGWDAGGGFLNSEVHADASVTPKAGGMVNPFPV
jgi:hypothetical protein